MPAVARSSVFCCASEVRRCQRTGSASVTHPATLPPPTARRQCCQPPSPRLRIKASRLGRFRIERVGSVAVLLRKLVISDDLTYALARGRLGHGGARCYALGERLAFWVKTASGPEAGIAHGKMGNLCSKRNGVDSFFAGYRDWSPTLPRQPSGNAASLRDGYFLASG